MKTQKVTQEKKTTFLLTDIYVANGSGLKYASVMRLMNKNQSVEDNEHVKLILMVKSSLICFLTEASLILFWMLVLIIYP